jgi:predicted DNA binding CopG/RHH family protein
MDEKKKMKKLKPFPKKIPHFKNYEEEASFWDTHDTSELIRDGRPPLMTFERPIKHLISIRLDRTLLHGLQTLAARRHLPYQTLIQSLLAEKLNEEYRKSA